MFNLNKSATAIAAAMVGTIKTGDDASRFAQRALAEGHTNISDLIAADAVKQAVAIRAAIDKADPMHNRHTGVLKSVAPEEITVQMTPAPQPITMTGAPVAEDEALPFTPLDAPAPPVAGLADTTSTSTTTVNAGSVDVDSEGLPWDGRIHSSNKKKITKDDTWQLRRGIDSAVVEQVKAELRQVMAIPKHDAQIAGGTVSLPMTEVPSPDGAPVPPAPPAETQGLHPEAGNTVQTAAAGTPQTGASSKPYSEYKLPDLMIALTGKRVTVDQVMQAANMLLEGDATFPSLPSIAARQDLIPLIAEALQL